MTQVFARFTSMLSAWLNWLIIVVMATLVMDVIWGVLTRYALGEQASWSEELARFLLVWVSMLGGAAAFRRKSHLGVDYLVAKFHPSTHRYMKMLSHFIVMLFAVVILVYGGSKVVYSAFDTAQTLPALRIQAGWVYLVLPITGCFIVIFTIEHLVSIVQTPATEFRSSQSEEEC